MRRALAALAALLLLAGCGGGDGGDDATTTAASVPPQTQTQTQTPTQAAPPPPTAPVPDLAAHVKTTREAPPGAPSVLFIGDSLGTGMADLLPSLLPGWRVEIEAQGGLPTKAGMEWWRARTGPYTVSAFSLFGNDSPTVLPEWEAVIRESVERPSFSQCAVWATHALPPRDGVGWEGPNALLHRLEDEYAGRLVIVPWAETVRERPELIAEDGVHGTAEGYAVRARLYADAIERCAG